MPDCSLCVCRYRRQRFQFGDDGDGLIAPSTTPCRAELFAAGMDFQEDFNVSNPRMDEELMECSPCPFCTSDIIAWQGHRRRCSATPQDLKALNILPFQIQRRVRGITHVLDGIAQLPYLEDAISGGRGSHNVRDDLIVSQIVSQSDFDGHTTISHGSRVPSVFNQTSYNGDVVPRSSEQPQPQNSNGELHNCDSLENTADVYEDAYDDTG